MALDPPFADRDFDPPADDGDGLRLTVALVLALLADIRRTVGAHAS